jgi:hypothetical protein
VAELNGGLTAPAAPTGLSSRQRPRSVNRRQTSKGKRIERAVANNQRARQTGPAIGGAVNADIGAQLSRRVASGAIDQGQADQVAADRQLLEEHYGPDWRDTVFGGAGRVQRLRQDIAEHGTDELGAKARLGQLLARRQRFLAKAEAA